MKKNVVNNQKVYTVNDFTSASTSIIVDDSKWVVDSIDYTKPGKVSGAPLFIVELRQLQPECSDPVDGLVDRSADMVANRTYVARDGRPMYNRLLSIWQMLGGVEGDKSEICASLLKAEESGYYRGHVERLSGVRYTKLTRKKTLVERTKVELWFPQGTEEGEVFDDFIMLCNRGVYNPIIEEPEKKDLLKDVDPSTLEALLAALKKLLIC